MEEATFRPVINTKNAFDGQGLNVAERNAIWAENKMKKLETLKAQKLEPDLMELKECTFKPQINYARGLA